MTTESTVHSCTPVVIFLASSRFFLWDRGVTAHTLGCVVNERFYPGCYSFISAQWGKRQHLYLLNLIWKRHTGGLSTQKKSIFGRCNKNFWSPVDPFFLGQPIWPNVRDYLHLLYYCFFTEMSAF